MKIIAGRRWYCIDRTNRGKNKTKINTTRNDLCLTGTRHTQWIFSWPKFQIDNCDLLDFFVFIWWIFSFHSFVHTVLGLLGFWFSTRAYEIKRNKSKRTVKNEIQTWTEFRFVPFERNNFCFAFRIGTYTGAHVTYVRAVVHANGVYVCELQCICSICTGP